MDRTIRIALYSAPTFLFFAATVAFSFTPFSAYTWIHVPFHSALEAAGATIAITLAFVLVYTTTNHPLGDSSRVAITAALISMGTLDLFHSFIEPGQTFVWLHSTATCAGGILFSLVWFTHKVSGGSTAAISVYCMILSSCFAILSILYPENTPQMLYENHFTLTAKALNFVGSLGFLAGSFWFFKNYYFSFNKKHLLFANHCLLFGVAGAIFEFSTIWDIEWWLWHATRFFAYLIALILIFNIHTSSEKQKEKKSRELKEALQNIKVLKGLLPICASCKKIRDDKGYWSQIESYISIHSEAEFSHGICPECVQKTYPEHADKIIHENRTEDND